ncbi:unnamed protein product [Haemonchus placei]|uniref:Reverse transcriptase domain-containing protein n=1 Tax=Haemonchus placei TaxID=6290 RepID=A0A158QQT9_HAEPC|nr:unnamed protein product [Haemonchus placei]
MLFPYFALEKFPLQIEFQSKLLNGIKQGNPIPEKLTTADVKLLFKKGDPNNVSSYRTISDIESTQSSDGSHLDSHRQKKLEKSDGPSQVGLGYADDVTLLASSRAMLKKMPQLLSNASTMVGLHINPEKSKLLTSSKTSRHPICIDGKVFAFVDHAPISWLLPLVPTKK